MKSNEEIIKSHVPDWVRWHEQCRKQVLRAMNEIRPETFKVINGFGKTFGTKAKFIKVEFNERFTNMLTHEYGLLCEFNDTEITIFFEEDKSHSTSLTIEDFKYHEMYFIVQEQIDDTFYDFIPHHVMNRDYELQN